MLHPTPGMCKQPRTLRCRTCLFYVSSWKDMPSLRTTPSISTSQGGTSTNQVRAPAPRQAPRLQQRRSRPHQVMPQPPPPILPRSPVSWVLAQRPELVLQSLLQSLSVSAQVGSFLAGGKSSPCLNRRKQLREVVLVSRQKGIRNVIS